MTEMLRNVYIDKLGKIIDEKHNEAGTYISFDVEKNDKNL